MTIALSLYFVVGVILACRAASGQWHAQPLERFLLAVGVLFMWPVVVAVELPQEIRERRYQREQERKFGDSP